MLPACSRVVVLPLRSAAKSPELNAFAAGITRDLFWLLERLGDLTIVQRDSALSSPPSGAEKHVIPEADLILASHQADYLVAGELDQAGTALVVQLAVFAPGRRCIHSAGSLRSGEIATMRLDWLFEVASAMASTVDPTAITEGYGTESLDAYRLYCLASDPDMANLERLQLLELAVEADPNFSEAWIALSLMLEQAGDSAGVLEVLEELILRHGDLAEARYHYARALHAAGETVAARAQIRQLTVGTPSAFSCLLAGRLCALLGEPVRGIEQLEVAIEGGCICWQGFAAQGDCFSAIGSHREAIASWQTALAIDSEASGLLGPLALAHHRLGEPEQSEALFERAVEQEADKVETHRAMGTWFQDRGKHDEAIEAFSCAISLQPSDALLYNNRGYSRFSVGDEDGARVDFETALDQVQHGELPFYLHLNLARLERGDAGLTESSRLLVDGGEAVREERTAEAIAMLQGAIRLFPESWKSWLFLALAYRQQGHWTRVADALSEVQRLRPDSASAWSEQALAVLALGRLDEALHCVERAGQLKVI